MSKIIVDEKLCTRCNICSSVCIMSIIQKADQNSLPQIEPAKEQQCFRCGHCEAFCPTEALTLDFLPAEKISLTPNDAMLDAKQLALYLKKRRTIRSFTNKPVEKELIKEVLESCRYAASGGNGQPVRWLVILDSAEIKKISALTIDWMRSIQNTGHPLAAYVAGVIQVWENGTDMICYNAPHLLIAHLPDNPPSTDNTDAIIAMTHFDIAAPAYGLGSCWAGFVTLAAAEFQPLQELVALPKGRRFAYGMLFGYPKLKPVAIPRRNTLKITWR